MSNWTVRKRLWIPLCIATFVVVLLVGVREVCERRSPNPVARFGGKAYFDWKLQPEGIDLTETDLSDDDLHVLDSVTDLRFIKLGGTKVSDKCLTYLKRFNRLSGLVLSDTGITDDCGSQLGSFPNLTILDLSWTRITDKVVPSLLTLSKLEYLFLFGTRLTTDGKERLQRGLPSLKQLDLSPATR